MISSERNNLCCYKNGKYFSFSKMKKTNKTRVTRMQVINTYFSSAKIRLISVMSVLFLFPFFPFAQNNTIDSLNYALRNAKHDTSRASIYLALTDELAASKPDTVIPLCLKALAIIDAAMDKSNAPEKKSLLTTQAAALNNIGYIYQQQGQIKEALDYYQHSLKIREEIKDQQGIAISLNNIGTIYDNQGQIKEALDYYHRALKIREEIKEQSGIANSLNNIGAIYNTQGQIKEALDYYYRALKIQEEIKAQSGIAYSLNNIGYIYNNQGQIKKALDYYHRALKIREEIKDQQGIAHSLNNIGCIYNKQGQIKEALDYYQRSLKIREEIKDQEGIAYSLNNIGFIYNNQGQIKEALDYYHRTLKILEEIKDQQGIAYSLNNIGYIYQQQGQIKEALDYYQHSLKIREEIKDQEGIAISLNSIGAIELKQKNYAEAKRYCQRSLTISKENGYAEIIRNAELLFARIDSARGNGGGAFEHYKQYIIFRDSIVNVGTRKASMKKQMQYEYEKKEAATQAEQEKKDAVAAEEKQKEKVIKWSVLIGLFLIALFAVFIVQRLRQSLRQKKIIEEQKKITEEQKKHIEEKHKETIDSINYAKRIQRALFPHRRDILARFPQSLVLFKPKDIVSGDFYYAIQKDNRFYLAACDCTGHGVPGAFMSLLNISFLNEAISEKGITQPNEIFNHVRERLIGSLEGGQDGMDAILFCFDSANNSITYAAANNAPVLLQNGKLISLAYDKMPVGFGGKTDSFKLHTIEPSPNFYEKKNKSELPTTFYLFTDGYADQFGGPKGKKFRYKQLEELLVFVQHKPMSEQHDILNKTIDDWKGNLEQLDDICIIGVKV